MEPDANPGIHHAKSSVTSEKPFVKDPRGREKMEVRQRGALCPGTQVDEQPQSQGHSALHALGIHWGTRRIWKQEWWLTMVTDSDTWLQASHMEWEKDSVSLKPFPWSGPLHTPCNGHTPHLGTLMKRSYTPSQGFWSHRWVGSWYENKDFVECSPALRWAFQKHPSPWLCTWRLGQLEPCWSWVATGRQTLRPQT